MSEPTPSEADLLNQMQLNLERLRDNNGRMMRIFEEAQDDLRAAVAADSAAAFEALLRRAAADFADAGGPRMAEHISEELRRMAGYVCDPSRRGIGPRKALMDPAAGKPTGWEYHVDYETRSTYLHGSGSTLIALTGMSWTAEQLRDVAALHERGLRQIVQDLSPAETEDESDLLAWSTRVFRLAPSYVLDKAIGKAERLLHAGELECARRALTAFEGLPLVSQDPDRLGRVRTLLERCQEPVPESGSPITAPQPLRGSIPLQVPALCLEEAGGRIDPVSLWEKIGMALGCANILAACLGHFRLESPDPRFAETFRFTLRGSPEGISAHLVRHE